ncbi:MAG TPA: DUF1722 domain-containing protein [Candidatus Thermoplasmatota archaeon]|nr:DUF1722 domain-containing protein [Candidatus Thermoplasmatota archaeon]
MDAPSLSALWREVPRTKAAMQAFHACVKTDLLARDVEGARALGRLAAAGAFEAYGERLAAALAAPASRGRHANALAHLAGHVGDPPTRRALARAVERYRAGALDLEEAKAAIAAALARDGTAWARGQTYLRA